MHWIPRVKFNPELLLFWVPSSLKTRLLLASVILLPISLIIAGVALQRAFENTLLTAEEAQARSHAYVLLGSAEVVEGELLLPRRVQEPRFSQLQSGLSGLVFNSLGELKWRSESSALLEDQLIDQISANPPEPGSDRFRHLRADQQFLYLYPLVWQTEDRESRFLIAILNSDRVTMEEFTTFQTQLWGWLGALYFVALLVQYLILRWGLKPLKYLAEDISHIEQGQTDKLRGRYPGEVEPVTRNLNRLIETERSQRERYRNTLADLAHSLKTPLAVIRGARSETLDLEGYQRLVEEQSARMNQIVQYQLSRAVKTKEQRSLESVSVEKSVNRIVSALQKVYSEKAVQLTSEGLQDQHFSGDERDLMELLGNLLENAFKYTDRHIRIRGIPNLYDLILCVEDDGPGVGAESHQVILQRGARLDTTAPGQGIGLAVCTDILSSYNGSLEVDRSPLGGAAFTVKLPKA